MRKKKRDADQPQQLTGHQKLERRRLLNADFDFTGGVLEISNFVDSDAGEPNQIQFEQTGATSYEITLLDGVFQNGSDSATVSGLGTDMLTLDNSLGAITSIFSRSADDVFDIQFGDFAFGGDITIEQDGGAAFGTVSQLDGTSLVSTGTLQITGADDIALDNTIGNDLGNIVIQNANSISLAEVNDVDALAIEASGDVTITSGGNVTLNGADIDGELDIITTSGDINVDATGDLVLSDISTNDGSVDVSTTGDIEIGSITAAAATASDATVDIDSIGGAINDLQDDSSVDIQASGIIQLNAIDEIGGSSFAGQAIDTAGRLEFAAGSALELDSLSDDIVIAGVGDLVLADLNAGASIDVVAAGDLTVAFFDAGDDGTLVADGNLTLEQAVTVGNNLLFDAGGDVSQLPVGAIMAAGLALQVDGDTVLIDADNDVQQIAVSSGGATLFANVGDLKVGTVGTDGSPILIEGVTTSDDDVKLVVAGNLTLEEAVNIGEGDLFLDVDGDVSQLATGTIDAAGLGLMVDGETVLNQANDLDVLAAVSNGATRVDDINDLKTGTVTVEAVSADRAIIAMTAMNGTVDAAAMSITGVTSSDDDFKLTAAGNVTLEEAVNLGEGDLFLDVAGDLSQLATGTIDAAGLGLMVDGDTVLNQANDIDVLATDNDGATRVDDINDLKTGTVTADAVSADRAMTAMNGTVDAAAMSITGVTSSDDDVKLTAAGNVTLEEAVNLGEGDLFLDVAGDLSQLATGTIDAAGLGLMVDGETVLNQANDIDVLATENDGATRVDDINDLKTGTVTADAVSADRAMTAMNGTVDAAAMSITGVTSSDDDVKLTAAGNVTLEEAVELGEGDLFLDVAGDLSQLATGTIDAAGLGLMVDGETVLNQANDIDVLATDNSGATRVDDINDLKTGTVTADAVSADRAMTAMNGTVDAAAMSITGVTSSDDDVKLTAAGNVTLEEAVNLGEGDLFLDVAGDLSQLATGTIDAAGLGLMVEGETLLNEANQIDVLAALNDGAIQVSDIDGFSVGTVIAEVVSADRAMAAMNGTLDAAAMSVTGVTTSGDDVKLTADGSLSVDEAINLVGGDLILDVNGDVSQSVTGTINAAGLGLMVDGETVLNEANDIDVLAANNNGITRVNDIDDLTVGIVTVEAVSADRAMVAMNGAVDAAAMSITGVTTSNDDVKLTAGGDVALLQAVDVGAGELFLDVNGNVTQSVDGTINADGLGLTVVGDVLLDNIANNTNNLAADVVGTLNFSDADGFTIASLECDGIVISGITTTVDLNVITNDGSIFQDDDAPLTIGGDTLFSTGAGDICLTNVNNIFDGDISLITTGEVVLATSGDLNITSTLVAGGGNLRFIADLITVSTDIVANQLLLQASSGVELVDTFTIDVTDLLLSGTGNFDLVNAGGNLIDNLAVDVDGDVMINNFTTLNIGSLTFVSDCGDVAISGVNVDAGFGGAGDFEVTTVDSDVTQSAAITVEGTTTVDAGTGKVKLNGADRAFERTGTTDDTTEASTTGDGLNDNDFNRVEATGSEVEIVDVNDLEAGDINAVDNIFLTGGRYKSDHWPTYARWRPNDNRR